MKKTKSTPGVSFKQAARTSPTALMTLLMSFVACLLALPAFAQTNMTQKPLQIRIEVPVGAVGDFYLTNWPLRIPTNGSIYTTNYVDPVSGPYTNWVIPGVSIAVSGGAPSGCTASVVDQGLINPVGTIPINMNTNNGSTTTNVVVKLHFDGTQTSGTSTLTVSATGGGLPQDDFLLPIDVAKIWNGSANAAANGPGNFGDNAQWLGGAPGASDVVIIGDAGAQTNNLFGGMFLTNCLVNTNVTIASLRFNMTNATGAPLTNFQNIFIDSNVTFTVGGAGGVSVLRDFSYWNMRPQLIYIWGTNGTFAQTNESSVFAMLSDAQVNSVLDMSGLGVSHFDVSRIAFADYTAFPNVENLSNVNAYAGNSTTLGQGFPQRQYGTWRLASTNFIKAVYTDPYNYTNGRSRTYAFTMGKNNNSGGGSGQDVEVYLGYSNVFNLDSMCVGGTFCLGADLRFLHPGVSYAKFRNSDGVSRMSIFATADAGGNPDQKPGAGDNTKLGGNGPGVSLIGTVDMLVDRFYLSMDRPNVTASGKGVSQSSGFTFSDGTIDANTAILGYQAEGSQTNQSYCYAQMWVSNTATFKVNGNLALGYTTCDPGSNAVQLASSGYGQLTIGPGGTVTASNILVGGVTKLSGQNKIIMLGGASLVVSNGIADATPFGALGTLSFAGANNSITLFLDGNRAGSYIYVTNFTATGSSGNRLIIGSTNNVTLPAAFTIMTGVNSSIAISAASFDAGVTMPSGSGLFGLLTNGVNNTIVLTILSHTPNNLVWRGAAGTANWDYTTKNWLDLSTGILTNYQNPDNVTFDGASSYATNISLPAGAALTPSSITVNVTNSPITFLSSANTISGGPILTKIGNGTLDIEASTTCSLQVNQGVVIGGGSLGNATVAAGAVLNFTGNLSGSLNCSGIATSAGTISQSLTVLNGGVVTNTGTVNSTVAVQTGGFLYNTGPLTSIGSGSAGSPTVATNATFINNGQITGDNLYVIGTFEDLGGSYITLNSLTLAPGSTFIPGGNTIGTTSLYSNGGGSFPGAALFTQGSTAILKVNAATTAHTVLASSALSFGASASAPSQNGCTLFITNVSVTPYSAGQTFHFFDEVYNSGTGPASTGSSTNTFPVVVPSTPGPGLSWDLSHIWFDGNIGVITTPHVTLTNSISIQGGTNIVAQFSWDPSYYGYRLQSLVSPLTLGLSATNWTTQAGSWTNTTMTITNSISTNTSVFYRLIYP